MERKSGVLMHVSSLFGEYSIGSFSDDAKYFIDFLCDCGFGYWQVLPFAPTDSCNSPYKSPSSFGLNLFFVSLEKLHEKCLITDKELSEQREASPYVCEFDRLKKERFNLLKKASERLTNRGNVGKFIKNNPQIENFCKFMAIKSKNGGKPWNEWSTSDYDDGELFAWEFIQYELFIQWKEIKEYANGRGIKIIGDIPIYVDYDSADVWMNKELFMLGEDGRPSLVAGVPPDFFSEDGQIWGNPLYDWDAMERDGFKWWRERIGFSRELFDGIRIDHFRAFESFFAIPRDAKSAKSGTMKKGPGMKLIDAIDKARGDTFIIAEDLGLITDEVRELLKMSAYPGMRVLQFAFMGDRNSPHLPHNYQSNCVAYTGTHDNNTLLAYLFETEESVRRRIFEYCGYDGARIEDGIDSIIRTMLCSHADTVIIPIQDLLKYGADTRLNTPGKAMGNWGYRITKKQLDSIDREYCKMLNELYSRL